MARRSTSLPTPQRAVLAEVEIRRALTRFERLLEKFKSFEPESMQSRSDTKIKELKVAARSALNKTFPEGSVQANQFSGIPNIDTAGFNMAYETPMHRVIEGLRRGVASSIVDIHQLLADLEEDLEECEEAPVDEERKDEPPKVSRTAFIVHGHDEAAKNAVDSFLRKISIKPIVLHEQPNAGRTLIEKFIANDDVGFAVILLTPDDVGRAAQADELQPRARQNVILELGYFIAKLGRERVCVLVKGEVDQPSDMIGIVYETLDQNGAWHQALARELQAAGIAVDSNAIMAH